MAHRVHPKIFRVRELKDWSSRWLVKKNLPKLLEEDFRIREFLKKKLALSGLASIEIERFPGKISIIIESARPGLIIGRGGEGIEQLSGELKNKIFPKIKIDLKIEIKEVKDPWQSASLASQWIAQQLEKRVPYRRVLKQALDKMTAKREVKGARVEVSGRLDGAEIARRQWLSKGELPRQTIRAEIDYGTAEALCTYGVVGVKAWIYKGEKFK